jgi:hypothetical protein
MAESYEYASQHNMGKDITGETSNYHIRKSYLQTMRQFMANINIPVHPKTDQGIDEYLTYEKQLSYHLQGLLNHSKADAK